MTGRALKDSIQIVSSFPEMEKQYSTLQTLRFLFNLITISHMQKSEQELRNAAAK